ncbi:hypothetical protein SO694_00097068 [Aureococcus anophagefferens]|uniref:Uncharacterized protein n=1 Tax=Aureococcus anophagefferens TaxID=44056 RepID=A0ABR1FSJ3_AURAN
MEKAHVERDAAHVADEFERMEALIEAQTSGDAARRHALSLEKERKDAELEELQRRSRCSRERDAVSAELGDCDDKIQLARSKFERQLTRLAQRDDMVKASAADCATASWRLWTPRRGAATTSRRRRRRSSTASRGSATTRATNWSSPRGCGTRTRSGRARRRRAAKSPELHERASPSRRPRRSSTTRRRRGPASPTTRRATATR